MPLPVQGGAVTLGNFDGVHLGHQALLMETVRQARTFSGPAVAVTFDPPPVRLLRPDAAPAQLTSLDHRIELLHQHGIDHVLLFRTTLDLLHLGAAEFFDRILRDGLKAKAIVEGFNFAFGRNREGTTDVLQSLGKQHGIPVTLVQPRIIDGKPVSSSRIRDDVMQGRVDAARTLLGRPYRLAGIVSRGAERGRTIGFPTANLDQTANLVPGNGVYAVQVEHQGKTWAGASNIGPNPTFGENARKIETHLIGFAGDLYGQTLRIDFLRKLRDPRPFASVDELKRQIQADIIAAQSETKQLGEQPACAGG
ncbi:MAG: bifunctional riboflavin kinase/FAD synthetase [Gemmataceae bacterium]